MKDISENSILRFKNLSQKKEGIFANFQVKVLKNGVAISATLSVDISSLELHAGDSMEKIVEECARLGARELKRADFTFEGLDSPSNLGVAQLG